ncbi:hypothetical protein CW714_09780 [Methanophagales archaeon]|nr:MAG: hypothetical protein CW714_09780 [Methanophagales archaeon]
MILDCAKGLAMMRRMCEFLMEGASFLVLAAEGFSEIDKIKAAHKSIKFESKPKLAIWNPPKINQLIIDEGLEI